MIELEDFEALVRERLRAWQAAAVRLTGNCPDGDDAVQNALIAAWAHRDQFADRERYAAFIYGVVVHKACDIVRSNISRERAQDKFELPTPRNFEELYCAIAELPTIYGTTVSVLLENDMNYDKAARILMLPKDTLYVRMNKAKRLLKGILSKKN